MCPGELAMFTNKTTRMFGVFAIVVAMMLELVTVASMPASDSALAVKAGSSSHSISKGKSNNSNSSANTTNTKPAKMIMILQLMNKNLRRGHREEPEEQEKQIREEWEEIEWVVVIPVRTYTRIGHTAVINGVQYGRQLDLYDLAT